jgi:hypothetical protein
MRLSEGRSANLPLVRYLWDGLAVKILVADPEGIRGERVGGSGR